ncbi:MAG TPA: hypothetical protein VLM05_06420 [Mycobacteriales bacterium]|nr:hypothetical protein [Mycobacteriales bacterium]
MTAIASTDLVATGDHGVLVRRLSGLLEDDLVGYFAGAVAAGGGRDEECRFDGYRIDGGTGISSPCRFRYDVTDRNLAALHRHPRLAETMAGFLGRAVRPTKVAMQTYAAGEFISLHQDQQDCTAATLVKLTPDTGPLYAWPRLLDHDPAELLDISRRYDGYPPGPVPLTWSVGDVLLVRGPVIPHARPPHRSAAPAAILSFCYLAEPAA